MKMKHPDYWIVIISFTIGILLFGLIAWHSGPLSKISSPLSKDTISYWSNKYGDMVASQRKTAEEFAIVNKSLRDSLAKAYNAKPKTIKEYVVVYSQSQSNLPAVTGTHAADYFITHDSCPPQIKNMRQSFANNYYSADVQIGDSSYLHLESKDTITVIWRTVKMGNIFNRKEHLQADISNANPDVKINALQMYREKQKSQKRFGIGVQGGYGFSTGFSPQPYVGIGLSYNIIRL